MVRIVCHIILYNAIYYIIYMLWAQRFRIRLQKTYCRSITKNYTSELIISFHQEKWLFTVTVSWSLFLSRHELSRRDGSWVLHIHLKSTYLLHICRHYKNNKDILSNSLICLIAYLIQSNIVKHTHTLFVSSDTYLVYPLQALVSLVSWN